ncbi:CENP-B-like protein [Smittium culicis]|uniref:CENP-B-like protein n=1 Tax=Smittium culicis TaxID=133412 RepID=A0A1R1XS06_9FUNG|nr:CENP-B-like protein [Smittium culicis]
MEISNLLKHKSDDQLTSDASKKAKILDDVNSILPESTTNSLRNLTSNNLGAYWNTEPKPRSDVKSPKSSPTQSSERSKSEKPAKFTKMTDFWGLKKESSLKSNNSIFKVESSITPTKTYGSKALSNSTASKKSSISNKTIIALKSHRNSDSPSKKNISPIKKRPGPVPKSKSTNSSRKKTATSSKVITASNKKLVSRNSSTPKAKSSTPKAIAETSKAKPDSSKVKPDISRTKTEISKNKSTNKMIYSMDIKTNPRFDSSNSSVNSRNCVSPISDGIDSFINHLIKIMFKLDKYDGSDLRILKPVLPKIKGPKLRERQNLFPEYKIIWRYQDRLKRTFFDIWEYNKKNPFYTSKNIATKFIDKINFKADDELIDIIIEKSIEYGDKLMSQLAQSYRLDYSKALHKLFSDKKNDNESITADFLSSWFYSIFGIKITEREISKLLSQSSYSFRFDAVKAITSAKEEIAEHTFVDDALYEWYLLNIDQFSWSKDFIENKGNSMIKIGYPTKETIYKIDDQWIKTFRESFNIPDWDKLRFEPYIDICSATSSKHRISNLLKNYSLKDVYNVSETGLFFRMQPEWSNNKVTYRPEKYSGKLAFIACMNGDGSDRLPFWITGNSVTPVGLDYKLKKKLGIFYSMNSTCRIKPSLFITWLLWFDYRMAGRKVCLLLQKIPLHASAANLKLSNVTLVYINDDSGNFKDPLNLGIFRSLRAHYRLSYHDFLIKSSLVIESCAVDFSIGNAIKILADSWYSSLDNDLIGCCFRDFYLSVGAPPPVNINSTTIHKDEISLLQKLHLQILSMGYSRPMQLWRLLEFAKESEVYVNSVEDDLIDMAEDDALAFEEYELSNQKSSPKSDSSSLTQVDQALDFDDFSQLVSFCSSSPYEFESIVCENSTCRYPFVPLSNNHLVKNLLVKQNSIISYPNFPSYNPTYTIPPYTKLSSNDLSYEPEISKTILPSIEEPIPVTHANTSLIDESVNLNNFVQTSVTESIFVLSREPSETTCLDEFNQHTEDLAFNKSSEEGFSTHLPGDKIQVVDLNGSNNTVPLHHSDVLTTIEPDKRSLTDSPSSENTLSPQLFEKENIKSHNISTSPCSASDSTVDTCEVSEFTVECLNLENSSFLTGGCKTSSSIKINKSSKKNYKKAANYRPFTNSYANNEIIISSSSPPPTPTKTAFESSIMNESFKDALTKPTFGDTPIIDALTAEVVASALIDSFNASDSNLSSDSTLKDDPCTTVFVKENDSCDKVSIIDVNCTNIDNATNSINNSTSSDSLISGYKNDKNIASHSSLVNSFS